MAWSDCDGCGLSNYDAAHPFVEVRQRRPSDQTDMCCVMAGHPKCVGVGEALPAICESGGVATPDQWEEWITNEGRKLGFLFLT